MYDLHSHIIYGVDDGPKSLEESIQLLKEAYRQGVRKVVATSHRRKGMFETAEEVIDQNFRHLKEQVEGILPDLELYYGAEIYYSSDVKDKLEKGQLPSLAGSRYVLVEFGYTTPYKEIRQALSDILRLGYTPLVAHIERYDALDNKADLVEELIDMGCYMQINAESLLKPKLFGDKRKFRKRRARYFLDHNLVHVVASDMHNLGPRAPHMQEARRIMRKDYGRTMTRDLFETNPALILADQEI